MIPFFFVTFSNFVNAYSSFNDIITLINLRMIFFFKYKMWFLIKIQNTLAFKFYELNFVLITIYFYEEKNITPCLSWRFNQNYLYASINLTPIRQIYCDQSQKVDKSN